MLYKSGSNFPMIHPAGYLKYLACVALFALSGQVFAEVMPYADFEIRYDEKPFSMEGGTMTWRGKAVIPLTRDTNTQAIKGTGKFPFSYEARVAGCIAKCTASVSMSIDGKAGIDLVDLSVTDKATSASCVATCPGGVRQAYNEHRDVYTDKVRINPSSPDPLPRKVATPGPTLYYTLLQDCAPQRDTPGPIDVSVKPGTGAWAVEIMPNLTLDDIRSRVPPNPKRLALTVHSFSGKTDAVIKTMPAKNGQVCYWVEKVSQTMDPIQVWIPGINWPQGNCEYKAIDTHEQKHVTDARLKLSDFSRDWIKAVQTAGLPRAGKPAKAASAEAARAATMTRIEELTAPLVSTWKDKFNASRARIDTDAEYAHVFGQCPRGWR